MAGNVIYRGPMEREPETINLPVVGAYLPGSFVNINASGSLAATTNGTGRPLILGNRRFVGQSITTPYAAGETAVAYRLEPEQEYNALIAVGAYTRGQELSAGPNGVLRASGAGNVVNFIFNEQSRSFISIGFAEVVSANSYIKA